jgi:SAM-dependent methyltransferase
MNSNEEWEKIAINDPLYGISSEKGKSGRRWTLEEFYGKGERYLRYISKDLDEVSKDATVLDFGCGVGRISRILARNFKTVIGLDVSESMVRLAKEYNDSIGSLSFAHYDGKNFPFTNSAFDLIVSFQVLQHVDPVGIKKILSEIYRVKKPDGIAILHLPQPSLSFKLMRLMRGVAIRRLLTKGLSRLGLVARFPGRLWVLSQYNVYSDYKIKELMKSVGFSEIIVRCWSPSSRQTAIYIAR